jgi:BolA protein
LREAFSPDSLQVVDESHLHEGHAGHRAGGETHFRVYIVSSAFKGKSRVERHRMINSTLAAELLLMVSCVAMSLPVMRALSRAISLRHCIGRLGGRS